MKSLHLRALFAILPLGLAACKTAGGAAVKDADAPGAEFSADAASGPAAPADAASDGAGGVLTIIAIPPPVTLDWSTPNKLMLTSAEGKVKGIFNSKLKRVGAAHAVGHLMVSMKCDGVEIRTTGQTGGGSEYATAIEGVGASFREFPGFLDDPDKVQPDLDLRHKSGMVGEMNFKITGKMCKHLAGFLQEYKDKGADKRYGGQYRPRRFEGAGCSSFGLAFVEVGGLLRRSLYTPMWAHSLDVGIGRVSKVINDTITFTASDGIYKYGSNLRSYDDQWKTKDTWPKDTDLLVQKDPTRPGSHWLSHWSDDQDASTNVKAGQPNTIPWTIYDPQLIYNFIRDLAAKQGGTALGRTWTAAKNGAAPVIETDATDATAQAYVDPEDDLMKD